MADPRQFRSGREFAAWLGLTPLQNSSGRQGPAWPHHQDGRPISAQAACLRRNLAGSASEAQAAQGGPPPPGSAGPKAGAGCERGDGGQDGACRLGHHGPR